MASPLRALVLFALVICLACETARAADLFIRLKLTEPASGRYQVSLSGDRHQGPKWYLPTIRTEVEAGQWSEWIDLSKWPLHGRLKHAGGVAEWPSVKATVSRSGEKTPISACAFEGQLTDKADEQDVAISFTERAECNAISFLLPNPPRENAKEFETGSQMTARQLGWAKEIAGNTRPKLKNFDICTMLWNHYDQHLAAQNVETLCLLGFNVIHGASVPVLRQAGVHVLGKTWNYTVDPEKCARDWQSFREGKLADRMATEDGKWEYANMRHLVISDEVKTLSFKKADKDKRDGWFRDYLRQHNVTQADLGKPIESVEFPLETMEEAKTLPRDADLPARRLAYQAAKFGHWWSAKQLRQTTDEIHRLIPGMKSETLPASHGFFNAWASPKLGMSYPLLDLFEVASQQAVDVLSAEDWLGLNNMYGPGYTWTGAQSFEYLSAIMRSGIGDRPIKLLGLITPSNDKYLRLKAYSCLGQGAKAYYFWTFGPTFISSENYWSDLRSEYEGIARFTRMLERSEDVLWPTKPVSDRVAILYSVSQDIWYPDQPAAFVEKRLLWHALRHLGVQPDFLREEDIEAGRLDKYQALFAVDWCISRRASAAIDQWAKQGGVVYMSGGTATRDENHELYVPPFAKSIWTDPARMVQQEDHKFNERTDLPKAKPLTSVNVTIGESNFSLPVLGCRLDVRGEAPARFAKFEGGAFAGTTVSYGKGQVTALGFMPMLAYGKLAKFQKTKLAEKWPAEPRRILQEVLDRAGVKPVAKADVPVVETSLLAGPRTSALVLVNYTYEPVASLSVDLRSSAPIKKATSLEHGPVALQKTDAGVRLVLPLEWTDVVLLEHE